VNHRHTKVPKSKGRPDDAKDRDPKVNDHHEISQSPVEHALAITGVI
jgi:hypothetical protein